MTPTPDWPVLQVQQKDMDGLPGPLLQMQRLDKLQEHMYDCQDAATTTWKQLICLLSATKPLLERGGCHLAPGHPLGGSPMAMEKGKSTKSRQESTAGCWRCQGGEVSPRARAQEGARDAPFAR